MHVDRRSLRLHRPRHEDLHKGLGITEAEWNIGVGHFLATLDKFKVPEKERNELVAIVASVKKDIVEKM